VDIVWVLFTRVWTIIALAIGKSAEKISWSLYFFFLVKEFMMGRMSGS